MFAGVDIFYIAVGFVACWYGKDTVQKWWQGAAAFASKLEAKASVLRSAIEAVAPSASAAPPAPQAAPTPPAA